jgi:integrase
VDLRQGRVYVRPEVEKAKRGRWVTVPLSLAERFREMQGANGGEYVFDQPEGLRRKNLLLREFYRCLKAAGIARDGSVDIHALRYTYVTGLLRRGVNLKVVQKLAGHSTLEMTLNIYAQVFKMDERDAVERLPWSEEVSRGRKVFRLDSDYGQLRAAVPSAEERVTADVA